MTPVRWAPNDSFGGLKWGDSAGFNWGVTFLHWCAHEPSFLQMTAVTLLWTNQTHRCSHLNLSSVLCLAVGSCSAFLIFPLFSQPKKTLILGEKFLLVVFAILYTNEWIFRFFPPLYMTYSQLLLIKNRWSAARNPFSLHQGPWWPLCSRFAVTFAPSEAADSEQFPLSSAALRLMCYSWDVSTSLPYYGVCWRRRLRAGTKERSMILLWGCYWCHLPSSSGCNDSPEDE